MTIDKLPNEATDVTAEACAWIAQLETGDLTPADVDAFREWIQRSQFHAMEIRRMARLSQELNVLTEMDTALKDAAAEYRPIVGRDSWLKRVSLGWGAGLATALVLFLVTSFGVFRGLSGVDNTILLETAVGDYLEKTLTDGSVVKLNTNSTVEVRYSKNKRELELINGEAYFAVAHNKQRPFYVYAAGNSVKAVGTAFAIRVDKQDFEVTVTEGLVELVTLDLAIPLPDGAIPGNQTRSRALELAPVILNTGQRAVITAQSTERTVVDMSNEEIQRELSWQKRLLEFSDTPLEEVVREVSRYSALDVRIMGPELSELRFGGVFQANDAQKLFEALETAYGVEVDYVDEETVLLRRARDE